MPFQIRDSEKCDPGECARAAEAAQAAAAAAAPPPPTGSEPVVSAPAGPAAFSAAEAESVRLIETCRDMVVAAYVAATRLEAAMRGRQDRMAMSKKKGGKGKKGKKGKK